MNDDRLERAVQEVLRTSAPPAAPAELRARVAQSLARQRRARARRAWIALPVMVVVGIAGAMMLGPLIGSPGPSPLSTPELVSSSSVAKPIGPESTPPLATPPNLPEPITDPGVIQGADLITANLGIVTNADGRVLVTSTRGATWRDVTPDALQDSGLTISAEGLDPLHLRLVTWNDNGNLGQDPAIWTSANAGQTWARTGIPIRRTFMGVRFLDADVAWALDETRRGLSPEIEWTSDGGRTWSELAAVVPPDGFTFASIVFVTKELGFLAAYDADQQLMSFRTTDSGGSWSVVRLPAQFAHPLGEPISSGFVFSDAEHGYLTENATKVVNHRVSVDRRVYVTADGGSTWAFQFELEMDGRWSLVRLGDQMWMANDGTERRLSTDGGQTWRNDDVTGLPNPAEYVSSDFVDASNGWAGAAPACLTDFCAFIFSRYFGTSDGGLTWSLIGDCAPGSEGQFCEKPAH
jgi:hypothetical protein